MAVEAMQTVLEGVEGGRGAQGEESIYACGECCLCTLYCVYCTFGFAPGGIESSPASVKTVFFVLGNVVAPGLQRMVS